VRSKCTLASLSRAPEKNKAEVTKGSRRTGNGTHQCFDMAREDAKGELCESLNARKKRKVLIRQTSTAMLKGVCSGV
jgi:hypothetical protein